MRVLHVTDSYLPATGGLERAVATAAHATARLGHDVDVVTLRRPDAPTEERDSGVRVRRIGGWSEHLRRLAYDPAQLFHPTAPDPGLVRRLQSLLDEDPPDIVHAHGWILNSCLALRLPRGTALVTTLHDHGLRCAKKTLVHRAVLDAECLGPAMGRCLTCAREHYGLLKGTALVAGLAGSSHWLDRVHMFLPISHAVARAGLAGVPADRVRVVPSFLPDSVLDEGARQPRPDFLPEGPFVLFVGAMSRHKGVDTLLAAHRLLRNPVPLVLLGPLHSEFGEPDWMTQEDVLWRPAVPHDVVMAAMRAAAVVAVPSRWPEPQGLVAVEAMIAGAPVVASEAGGLVEMLNGAGLLVPPGDPEALAAGISAAVDDEPLRSRLRAAGRARGRRYTESAVMPELLTAYEAAVDIARQPRQYLSTDRGRR